MATIDPSITEITTRGDHGHMIVWGPLHVGDVGAPISMIGSGRRTVQVVGPLALGAKVAIEGSNDGINYEPLRDVHGNQLNFNRSGISTIQDLSLYIRPRATVGDPDATIYMLIRKTEAR